MNTSTPSSRQLLARRVLAFALCLFPTLLSAHPGHYHPGEEDEFDLLKSTVLHSHGAYDFVLAGLVLGFIAVAFFAKKPAYRIGAFAGGVSSLILISVL
ncbi:MAG: hypothetical protein H8M99_12810 [Gloeobacteraceae cyanobacterium ES-bin-144]|nr:hypothetical protein [Verrucomicrobiales bacterium]